MFNDHFLEGFPPCNQLSEYNFALSLRILRFIGFIGEGSWKCIYINVKDLDGFIIYNPLYNTEIVAPPNYDQEISPAKCPMLQ